MACHLRVGVVPIPVYSIINPQSKTIQVTGLTDVMFSLIKQVMNCTYSYHLPPKITYGARTPNGTWSPGLLSDLQNNVIDMTLPCVARTAERDTLAEPTPALFFLPIGIMGGRNTTQDTNMSGYLLTFDTQVWALFLVCLALLSIVFTGLDFVMSKMEGLRTSAFSAWTEHFWMLVENMLWEASPRTPRATSLRILSAAWWLAILVLMNSFAGQLRACLMVKNDMKKIDSMADIAAMPKLSVYVLKDSSNSRYLQTHPGQAERAVWNMIQQHRTAIHGLYGLSRDILMQIGQGKAVAINALLVSQKEATKKIHLLEVLIEALRGTVERYTRLSDDIYKECTRKATTFCANTQVGEFYFARDLMTSYMFGAYMSRQMNGRIRHGIEKVVVALRESGMSEYMQSRDMDPLERCAVAEEQEELKLREMASIFYLYAFSCALCGVAFLAELAIHFLVTGSPHRHSVSLQVPSWRM